MKAQLSRFDMHCYALHERYITERAASIEIKADTEQGPPKNPLQDIQVSFNGLRPMSLYKFINEYARKDEEANLILVHLMNLFKEDMAAGLIPGAKGKEDFPKWLIARFGDDNPDPDVLIINPGEENMKYIEDQEESKHLSARWNLLGFNMDLDEVLKDFVIGEMT